MTVPIAADTGGVTVRGELTVPADATGTIVLAHDSAVCRHSPRIDAVVRTLQDNRLATIVADLLDPREEGRDDVHGDVDLLATRLLGVLDEVRGRMVPGDFPLALFGSGAAAAAALVSAADHPQWIDAVVVRDGRPGLAGPWLDRVTAPVLFLVGEGDKPGLRESQRAGALLGGPHELRIVPGATHLFEQREALEGVAVLASFWLRAHLPGTGSVADGWAPAVEDRRASDDKERR
ncbi:hypothetical protein B0I33_106305 [Prauserella shujinwangii]|uniref:Dienelactone hydrolase n=1 Tax=Prauserella shujinwangii TaxID=1453103 RepID=A0A2T0LU33_9PSEU|nr:alpha/beta hydrolase [Prauserella shujinwangii]PRX47204.1 hypothetical protein B0I33_106305 [Prauserella shujinwangii]